MSNPTGLRGLAFIEFVSPDPGHLATLFRAFGFSRRLRHPDTAVDAWEQGEILLLVNREPGAFAARFAELHGPSICSMGWRVDDAEVALREAVARGAVAYDGPGKTLDVPAVMGIGDSLIYFLDKPVQGRFMPHPDPVIVADKGFVLLDHLTHNVHKGTLSVWSDFYRRVFGFEEVRSFDIRGERTGLFSYALRSPDGSFCIPINEGNEAKSQIEEYLREYRGAGIQHLAFLTDDLLGSLDKLAGSPIQMLDIDDEYYQTVFDRVPDVKEDHGRIQRHQVLVDGDDDGYLLQIFTKNLVGPIFIELIQRRNHLSFGEGNFGALFRSIERDQERRGVL